MTEDTMLKPVKCKHCQVVEATVVLMGTFLLPNSGFTQDRTTPPTSTPDNSTVNKAHQTTADRQIDKSSDRQITQRIRQSLVADRSLSTNAHNCKIITRNGRVTLKGIVNTEHEKQAIVSKAADIVGNPHKINDELTVKH
jgi:hyperosmotically inducible periplasmic protein